MKNKTCSTCRFSNHYPYFKARTCQKQRFGWSWKQGTDSCDKWEKIEMKDKSCLNCDCYDPDLGCTMPSVDRGYACPLEPEPDWDEIMEVI